MITNKDYSKAPIIIVHISQYGGVYGKGFTLDEAKANLKANGGKLTSYIAYQLPEGAINAYVNDWNQLVWSWADINNTDDTSIDTSQEPTIIAQRGMK
jgi:hypothetical protein